MMTVFATVANSSDKKSDTNPVKRIESLGKHLSGWAEDNLCRETDEGPKCLKSQDVWMNRILQLTTRLASRYEKCGSVPNRSERRRREDANDKGNHTVTDNDSYDDDEEDEFLSNDMSQQQFDLMTSENYGKSTTVNNALARYAKNNPAKAVSQLCTAISKWTKDYLQSCQGRREMNNGYLQTVLRMAKWKVVLHNAYLKANQIEANSANKDSQARNVPGNGSGSAWQKWFDRKTSAEKLR